jgi:hypothetical protein
MLHGVSFKAGIGFHALLENDYYKYSGKKKVSQVSLEYPEKMRHAFINGFRKVLLFFFI